VSQSGSLTISAAPQAGTDYIYTTAYISQGSTWTAYTLSGNTTQEKAKLDVRALELENSQKRIEIGSLKQTPINYQVKLKLEKVNDLQTTGEYGKWYGLLYLYVQNNSKSEIYINSARIDQYLGDIQPEQEGANIRRFNPPDEEGGPIRWAKVGSTEYLSIERSGTGGVAASSIGGPAFGRLQLNEGSTYTPKYQIKARPHSMVGFIVSLRVEDNRKPWLWQMIVTRSTDDETEDVVESLQRTAEGK
jgi:hypothetical protein